MEEYLDIFPYGENYSVSENRFPYPLEYSCYREACEYVKSREIEAIAFKAQICEAREISERSYNEMIMTIKNSTSEESMETDNNLLTLENLMNEVNGIKIMNENMNENLKLILEKILKSE